MLRRPLLMQASGTDAAFEYTAQETRQLMDALATEGILGTADLKVTQRAAGANFTVDVAAGRAVVDGDSVAYQGAYLVVNDAVLTGVTIPAAPASGSRTHRVVLRVNDYAHDGAVAAGTYEAAVVVLEDTGTGTPAEPDSAITLATVTVSSTTVSITNAKIADGRGFARALNSPPSSGWSLIVTSETTTSVSGTDLATVGPDVTFTASVSGAALVLYSARASNSVASGVAQTGPELTAITSGAAGAVGHGSGRIIRIPGADGMEAGSHVLYTGLTPGAQYRARLKYSTTTGNTATYTNRRLSVVPL